MHAGVDEAGRGPVLGPLVIAGVAGDPRRLPHGITDSKKLSPARRDELAEKVRACGHVRCALVEVSADELNRRMAAGENLNEIETAAFVAILNELGSARAVVDTLGSRPDVFGATLTARLGGRCVVEARVGADASDRMVGAASILAKVHRDRRIREIGAELGATIGSGYSSDPLTRAFLADWRTRSPKPPPHARTAWSTLSSMGFGTRSLLEFPGDDVPR